MTDNQVVKTEEALLKKVARLIFLLVCVNAVGFVGGSFVTRENMMWYKSLPLSSLTPPDYVFSFVWPILYILMAISMFLVWNKASPRFFALQLMCTVLWPFVFFHLHSVIAGIGIIIALIVLLSLTIKTFYPVSKTAALLLIPQLIWSMFALYLNSAILWG